MENNKYYSLEEAQNKLGKSEKEIQQLVSEGQLKEFRSPSGPMYPCEQVDAVAGGKDTGEASQDDDLLGDLPDLELEGSSISLGEDVDSDGLDGSSFLLSDDSQLNELGGGLEESDLELLDDDTSSDLDIKAEDSQQAQQQQAAEQEIEPKQEQQKQEDEDLNLELEPQQQDEGEMDLSLDDSDLSLDTDKSGDLAELSSGDTDATGEGVNILSGSGETDFEISDDSSETKLIDSGEEALDEKPLDDEEVNLESFGSGSGLLDLSLQADDTSLGAVLDDIYPEGGEPEGESSVPTEADKIFEQPSAEPAPTAAAGPVVPLALEAPPDASSNAFGAMLFIPLLTSIFAGIIVIAGFSPKMISLLEPLKGMTGWYIAGAGAAITIIWAIVAGMMGGAKTGAKPKKQKAPKPKKEKKAKAPKPKKEKKQKKK